MSKSKTISLLAALLLASAVQAAEDQRMYAVIDYMRVEQSHSPQEYLALEKVWQKLHRKAVDSGVCRGWHLVRLENGGRNEYATIRLYDNAGQALNPFPSDLYRAAFNEEDLKTVQETEEIRHLTRSEIWMLEAAAMKEGTRPEYIIVHFMKPRPSKGTDYYSIESTLFRKYHQARVDKGVLEGWLFMSRLFPSGYDCDFDFVTINAYANKEASLKGMGNPESLGLKLDDPELKRAGEIFECRDLVREEIWIPLMQVEPKQVEHSSPK